MDKENEIEGNQLILNCIEINPREIIEQRIIQSFGLNKYSEIQSMVMNVDVSQNIEFQTKFNAFYKVRRNIEWRKIYYELFENLKKNNHLLSFSYILEYMYEKTGNIEASFSSKMLATLNPNFPIWDKYVLKNLGIKLPSSKDKKNLNMIIEYYLQICNWYKKYLELEEGKKCVDTFNQMIPSYKWISSIKKIDFFLWGTR